MKQDLTSKHMLQALKALDQKLSGSVTLIIGGGGAMVLAHQFPLSTSDIDAISKGIELSELDALVKEVAVELSIAKDWLNPYYGSFIHTLPPEYGSRLITVYEGKFLQAKCLGKEDLLIMKCFAGRPKDISHARVLIRSGASTEVVEKHIRSLQKNRIPGAKKALVFLHEQEDWLGDQE